MMAPLQKRALYGLLFGVVWTIAIVVVFIVKGGVTEFKEDQSFRIIMDVLFVGGLVVYIIMMLTLLGLRRSRKGTVALDERDKAILDRAPFIQLLAVIFLILAWAIGLSESYWDEGQVPVMFLYLMFFSTLIISTLAQSLGILIGYWRMNRRG